MDNLVALPGWDAAGKERLAATIVSKELGVEPALVMERMQQLKVLLPGLASRLGTMRTADVARLAASVPDVAARLVRLRGVFKSDRCDVAAMCSIQPSLLSEETEAVAAKLEALRRLFPTIDVEALAAAAPRVLDVERTAVAAAELTRLMGGLGVDIPQMIAKDPDMLLSVQKGDDIIPYDNGSEKQVQASLRARRAGIDGGDDEPDASPEGW